MTCCRVTRHKYVGNPRHFLGGGSTLWHPPPPNSSHHPSSLGTSTNHLIPHQPISHPHGPHPHTHTNTYPTPFIYLISRFSPLVPCLLSLVSRISSLISRLPSPVSGGKREFEHWQDGWKMTAGRRGVSLATSKMGE